MPASLLREVLACKVLARKVLAPGTLARNTLAVALVIGSSGAVLARGGGTGGGDGLSPYAALSGNDRSAGVNNGNYRDPALDPYLGAYGDRYERPVRGLYRPSRRPYYGTPY